MLVAGAMEEVVPAAAAVVVVLAALRLAARRRAAARAPQPPHAAPNDPFDEPVAQRLPPDRAGAFPDADRRRAIRAAVVRPVVVHRDAGMPPQERTFALDLGVGGALLSGPADLTLGEALELQVDVGEPIAGRARVVRETPDGCKGVAFEELDGDDRDRLERYVRAAL
jgi:hypothetical protein